MKHEPSEYKIDFDEMPKRPRNYPPKQKFDSPRMDIRKMYSQKYYFSLIIVGIIIIIVGIMIRVIVQYYFVFDIEQDVKMVIFGTSEIIRLLGLMFLFIGMIYGALRDESLHPHIRLGMLITVGLIFGFIGYSSIYN